MADDQYPQQSPAAHHFRAFPARRAAPTELRRELDYLSDRRLVDLAKQPIGIWYADLTRLGVDIAEYTIDCQPGIARPEKYWES